MTRRPQRKVSLHVAGIDAELTYKKMRNLRIRVLAPDGRVAVSAPHGVSQADVSAFVAKNRDWILRHQEATRAAAPPVESLDDDDAQVKLWGEPYRVLGTDGPRVSALVLDEAAILLVTGPSPEAWKKALEDVYRSQIATAVERLLVVWEPLVGRSASRIKYRRMTSRWGSCNTRTRDITLNTALAEWQPWALEYVLVHELVHLHERGHGPAFVAWMDMLLPDWRERRTALRGTP